MVTFSEAVDLAIEEGFYLHRANSYPESMNQRFQVILGANAVLYQGVGDTLISALCAALESFTKDETWPPIKVSTPTKTSNTLTNTVEELGWKLD